MTHTVEGTKSTTCCLKRVRDVKKMLHNNQVGCCEFRENLHVQFFPARNNDSVNHFPIRITAGSTSLHQVFLSGIFEELHLLIAFHHVSIMKIPARGTCWDAVSHQWEWICPYEWMLIGSSWAQITLTASSHAECSTDWSAMGLRQTSICRISRCWLLSSPLVDPVRAERFLPLKTYCCQSACLSLACEIRTDGFLLRDFLYDRNMHTVQEGPCNRLSGVDHYIFHRFLAHLDSRGTCDHICCTWSNVWQLALGVPLNDVRLAIAFSLPNCVKVVCSSSESTSILMWPLPILYPRCNCQNPCTRE